MDLPRIPARSVGERLISPLRPFGKPVESRTSRVSATDPSRSRLPGGLLHGTSFLSLLVLLACGTSQEAVGDDSASAVVPSAGGAVDSTMSPGAAGTVDSLLGGQPDATHITPDGWGPLRIGMTRAEVVAAAGEDANPNAVGGPIPEECDEFRPREAPDGVLLMLEQGVLTRISISRNREIESLTGIRIGEPAGKVMGVYGDRASVLPHKYSDAPASYITVWREASDSAGRRGIRYETDLDGEVAHIRAGGPSIEYVEGCL